MSGPASTNITYSDTVIAAGWDGRKFGVGITSLEIRTLASFRILDYTITEEHPWHGSGFILSRSRMSKQNAFRSFVDLQGFESRSKSLWPG